MAGFKVYDAAYLPWTSDEQTYWLPCLVKAVKDVEFEGSVRHLYDVDIHPLYAEIFRTGGETLFGVIGLRSKRPGVQVPITVPDGTEIAIGEAKFIKTSSLDAVRVELNCNRLSLIETLIAQNMETKDVKSFLTQLLKICCADPNRCAKE